MRPASFRQVFGITALCLVTSFFSSDGLASAQAAAQTQRKLSQRSLLNRHPVVGVAAARRAKPNGPPPATTDTWTGGGSNADWSNASNWNNGAITSGENIAISLTTAATTSDQNFTIGTLTMSNTGDSVTVNGGTTLTVGGAISNAGTIALANNSTMTVAGNMSGAGAITLNSTGNFTELELEGNVTLSGGTLTMSNNTQNYIFGANSLDQLTNQETIQGAGQIGHGQMALVNSGPTSHPGSQLMLTTG